jgi:glutaredoxin
MKIIIYTITDCQFSKQEKDYLVANKLQYEEKNLEVNKDYLTEMLAISNNFAGTPVTKIEKDDGNIVILKGFTKEEFDTTLGLTPPPNEIPNDKSQTPNNNQPAPTVAPPVQPVVPPTPVVPTTPSDTNNVDPLASVLEDLQTRVDSDSTAVASDATKVDETPATSAPTPPPTVSTDSNQSTSSNPGLPNIPDFNKQM